MENFRAQNHITINKKCQFMKSKSNFIVVFSIVIAFLIPTTLNLLPIPISPNGASVDFKQIVI